MFQPMIREADSLLSRLQVVSEAAAAGHIETLPDTQQVSYRELQAWSDAAVDLVVKAFGADSPQKVKWDRKREETREAIMRSPQGGAYEEAQDNILRLDTDRVLLNEFQHIWVGEQSLRAANLPPGAVGTLHFHYGDTKMGDTFNTGQAGAVGPGAHAHDMTFNQNSRAEDRLDLPELATELAILRERLLADAKRPEEYVAIGAVAAAETEAKKSDGPKTLEYLSKAGAWVMETASKIGTEVAAGALKEAMGLK